MKLRFIIVIGVTFFSSALPLILMMFRMSGPIKNIGFGHFAYFGTETPFTLPLSRESVTLTDGTYMYHLNHSQFEYEFPYLQRYQCSFILTPWTESKKDIHSMLILAIKSHPQSGSRREVLRRTWAREEEFDGYIIRPIFLIGQTDVSGQMEIVKKESQEFGDILQWDIYEEHHNLSLKEFCFLDYLYHQIPEVTFIFKGDDDVYVNPSGIIQYIIKHGSSPQTLHGALQRHSVVMRTSKYQISKAIFPNNKYPYFLSGGGFIYPGATVKVLYEKSKKIPVFPLDDVYFGFLALAANLTYRHDKRFHVFGLKYDACNYQRALVVHNIDPNQLQKMWLEIKSTTCKDINTDR
ncbi:beta-1,3-galactosyltransferase 5 [Bombina bombina]|uniref:beta-1,3-galactosyltransferase 5 n=1 Tax=Bombina bombina TaxID=8345 RepID=UPI00235AECC2|nr:beta-1,3-galactosyltransferase 5 [Bombina bombina]XP_053574342.1 beta-1,3-galactosyltransferase 5 [Bombina bombina]